MSVEPEVGWACRETFDASAIRRPTETSDTSRCTSFLHGPEAASSLWKSLAPKLFLLIVELRNTVKGRFSEEALASCSTGRISISSSGKYATWEYRLLVGHEHSCEGSSCENALTNEFPENASKLCTRVSCFVGLLQNCWELKDSYPSRQIATLLAALIKPFEIDKLASIDNLNHF